LTVESGALWYAPIAFIRAEFKKLPDAAEQGLLNLYFRRLISFRCTPCPTARANCFIDTFDL
jgi:hypothetical protein